MSGQATSAMPPQASEERNASARERQARFKRNASASERRTQCFRERAKNAMLPQASDTRNAAASERQTSQARFKRNAAASERRTQKNRPQNEVGFRLYVSSNYSASVSATTVKATLAWISLYNLTTAVYSPNSLASFITMLLRSTSRPNLANSSATWMLLTEP